MVGRRTAETLAPLPPEVRATATATGGAAAPHAALGLLMTVVALVLILLSWTMVVGADTMWLVALGDHIRRSGQVPTGVPFATADSTGWVNVPVLGELAFSWLHSLGPLGLPFAQLVVATLLVAVVIVSCRGEGAGTGAAAGLVALFVLGTLPALGVVRAQTLSLLPFAVLVLILRREHRAPSRRVWLVVPLIALWGNLHGAVLLGVAVTGAYLLLSRLRKEPVVAVGAGAATVAALFVNPGLLNTPKYYLGVLTNEALDRGSELWSAPRLDKPLDLFMIAAAAVLLVLVLRGARRVPLWEWVVVAALGYMTISSARHGVWLIMFLVPAAARSTSPTSEAAELRPGPALSRAVGLTLVVAFLLGASVLVSRQGTFDDSSEVVAQTARLAGSEGVALAPEPLVETLAAEGVRVWMGNPIDAFTRADQAAYLDFIGGAGSQAGRALAAVDVVVAKTGSAPATLASGAGFVTHSQVGGYDLMVPADAGERSK